MTTSLTRLRVTRSDAVLRVWLNHPEVRNAFDDEMIAELTRTFAGLAAEKEIRAVVLAGEGKIFCAGADINWMRRAGSYAREDNIADARRMAAMLRTIDICPCPVIGRIQGAAIGGGVGLAAVCDVVIAAESCVFSLAEVRLGILPAAISPYVLRAIGARQARDYFLTGDRFDASEARRIGLVHRVVPEEELDAEVEKKLAGVLASGPEAVKAAKALVERVVRLDPDAALTLTAEAIADRRASAEAKEGLSAFLDKRPAAWTHR